MIKKTLFFVRHCESDANARDILASRIDFSLTPTGHKQAKSLADRFAQRFHADTVYASPLCRAQQTASYIAERLGTSVLNADGLTEQELGIFSGLRYHEIDSRNDYQHDRSKRWEWQPPGGESYEMIYRRVQTFFSTVIVPSRVASMLCVSHAVTLRMVRAFLENTAPAYPTSIAENGEVWRVEFTQPGRTHNVESYRLVDDIAVGTGRRA